MCSSAINNTPYMENLIVEIHFDRFAARLKILKIYEPRSWIGLEKRGQTLFFHALWRVTGESNEMVV